MRRCLYLLGLLLAAPLVGFGQETKTVTDWHENPWYKEEFEVLKAARKTRHGAYRRYDGRTGTMLSVSGYYTNGARDSIWTEYHWGSKMIPRAQGHYQQDQPAGVWSYYNQKGELEQQYDHSRRQLVFNDPTSLGKAVSFKALETPFTVAPIYIGGSGSLQRVMLNVRYPAAALQAHESGVVRIAFTIGPDGHVTNYRVARSVTPVLDAEALRAARLLPESWLPAQSATQQAVAAECELPFTFQIR